MIVVYAPGGGFGHVTRARRVVEALGISATIVGRDDIPPSLEGNVSAHRDWIASLGATRLIVDVFPAGIQGELSGLDLPMDYVARLLRWDEYVQSVGAVTWPRFGCAYVVEALTDPHAAFVHAQCDRVVQLPLECGGHAAALDPKDTPYWLVVHSGPADEVRELVAYADEVRTMEASDAHLLVASPCSVDLPRHSERIDAIPAHPYFERAERIISAAGFNVMLETEPFREKHLVVPFQRRFDDQFARAARRKLRA